MVANPVHQDIFNSLIDKALQTRFAKLRNTPDSSKNKGQKWQKSNRQKQMTFLNT